MTEWILLLMMAICMVVSFINLERIERKQKYYYKVAKELDDNIKHHNKNVEEYDELVEKHERDVKMLFKALSGLNTFTIRIDGADYDVSRKCYNYYQLEGFTGEENRAVREIITLLNNELEEQNNEK